MGITESRVCQIRTQSVMRLRAALRHATPSEVIDRLLERRAL